MAQVNDIFNKAKDHLRAIAGDAMAISVKENKKLLEKLDDIQKNKTKMSSDKQKEFKSYREAILSQIKAVEDAVNNQEVAETVTIKNPEAITGDLKKGLEDIISTLKEEVKNFDKQVVVKNDLGQLATLFKSSNDRKEVVKTLNAVKDSVDNINIPEIPDTSKLLVRLIEAVENKENLAGILGEIRDKEVFLPPVLDVNLDPNLVEKDRLKVVLRDDQVANIVAGGGMSSDKIVDALNNIKIDTGDIDMNTDELEGLIGTTNTQQTDGSQKSQIVDAGGEVATVTGGKLDVNTTVETPTDMEGGGFTNIGLTPVELTFTGTTQNIIISASLSNTGIIYIGKSNVLPNGNNAVLSLGPGEAVDMSYDDVSNAVYAVSDAADQEIIKGALLK